MHFQKQNERFRKMMNELPKDPMILLSFVNTQLRDFFQNLADFCYMYDVSEEEIKEKLSCVGYEYQEQINRFV